MREEQPPSAPPHHLLIPVAQTHCFLMSVDGAVDGRDVITASQTPLVFHLSPSFTLVQSTQLSHPVYCALALFWPKRLVASWHDCMHDNDKRWIRWIDLLMML